MFLIVLVLVAVNIFLSYLNHLNIIKINKEIGVRVITGLSIFKKEKESVEMDYSSSGIGLYDGNK